MKKTTNKKGKKPIPIPIKYPRVNQRVVKIYTQNFDRLITDQAASDIRGDIEYQYKTWVMNHNENWLKDQEKKIVLEIVEDSFFKFFKNAPKMTSEEITKEKTKFNRQTTKASTITATQTNLMNYPICPSILAANREEIEAFKKVYKNTQERSIRNLDKI